MQKVDFNDLGMYCQTTRAEIYIEYFDAAEYFKIFVSIFSSI